jgi:hypothetical protein
MLLVNKDEENAHAIRMAFEDNGGRDIFPAPCAWSLSAANNMPGMAKTPMPTPTPTCRP